MRDSLTRREFLKTTAATVAATALAGNVLAEEPAPAKKRNLKKGIMWACIPGQKSVLEKFKMVKEAHYDGIEIQSEINRQQVLAARDATGLQIPTVVCDRHWRKTLSDPNPAVRAEGLEGVKLALQDAKAYGSTTLLLVPGICNQNVSYDKVYARSQEEIKKVLAMAEELGVKIGIENVWNNFLLSPLEAARYIDEFNSPAMAWHFDIGNVMNTGWPEQWIPILNTRIHKLHVKEYSRKKRDAEGLWKGFQVEYLTGDNDWPAIMKALDDIGYQGWGTAEPSYTPPGVDDQTRLNQVSEKLDQIFAL